MCTQEEIRRKILLYNKSLDVIPFGITEIPKSEDLLITVEPMCLADKLIPEGVKKTDGRVLFRLFKENGYCLNNDHKRKLKELVLKVKESDFW